MEQGPEAAATGNRDSSLAGAPLFRYLYGIGSDRHGTRPCHRPPVSRCTPSVLCRKSHRRSRTARSGGRAKWSSRERKR